jgi:Pentapeptide repeats (8 copies)
VDQRDHSRWRPTRGQLLWAGGITALAFLTIVIFGYLFGWKWTGFDGRTLWDWLKLLLAVAVHAVIAIFGQMISTLQYRGQQEAEENRAQDEALQAYLGEMGNLMLEQGLGRSQENNALTPQAIEEIRTLTRARTLTLVRTLAGDRKRRVVDFLYEAKLIVGQPPQQGIVDLGGIDRFGGAADLSGADLDSDHLAEADLSGANLTAANLREANLQEANVAGAYLSDANLSGAELRMASLSEARLRNANL